MTRDLCAVFASIGVRGSEDAYQNLIDDFCVILDMTVVDGIWTGIHKILGENMRKNLKRLWT